ncbi:MAG: hypothetical protein E7387_01710 [Ruminococcaceae bacterium]|nr:hypothetical protein [Oscillospiraceae bacterium]
MYLFAEIPVLARYNYDYLEKQCVDYVTDKEPQMVIEVTEEDVAKERAAADDGIKYPAGYLESLAFYRKFCEAVALQNVLLFHSAAVEVDGKAYLFTAPSGTGKTTHIALWKKIHGEKMTIVNGDKPLLKVNSDEIIVYGTPWDGKERQSTNASAKVAGICILTRGKENKITRIASSEALATLMSQTFRPAGAESLKKVVEGVITLSSRVPVWKLECNISEEAARVSYEAMSKG